MQRHADNPSLGGFLEEVALVADIDNLEEDADHVVMMTLHSAKGLEFPVVFHGRHGGRHVSELHEHFF